LQPAGICTGALQLWPVAGTTVWVGASRPQSAQAKSTRPAEVQVASRMVRDGGAVYTNGCFAEEGVYIAENYITDSPDFAAIYMDTGSSDITIEKNVIENIVDSVEYNWTRGAPADSTIIDNYVMADKHALSETALAQNTVIVSDALWTGDAKNIADNAGLYTSLRGLTECHERYEAFGTAYDWFGPNEVLGDNDILIDCTDYNPGVNEGYFAGSSNGVYLKPAINTRGRYRTLLAGFVETMWYKYDIEVPVAGRYRVELRYSMGNTSQTDTVYGYASLSAAYNNGSNLNKVPLRGTQTYFVSQPSVRLGELNLPEGANTIQLLNSGGSWGFDSIKLVYIGD